MLYNAFKKLLASLVAEIYSWVQASSTNLIGVSLQLEQVNFFGNPITTSMITSIYNYIYGAVLILVVLKLLSKGFNVYILWRDGDSEQSPRTLLIGIAIALAASIAFPTLYSIGVKATTELGDGIMQQISDSWLGNSAIDSGAATTRAEHAWYTYLDQFDENKNLVIDEGELEAVLNWSNAAMADDSAPDYAEKGILGLVVAAMNLMHQQISLESLKEIYITAANNRFSVSSLTLYNLGAIIALLIYGVMYMLMYVKLIGRSIEMLFLRLGFPIAAIGYIDSDGGVMHSYIQLIFRQFVTSILQVVAMYLSYYSLANGNAFFGIAIGLAAFRAPVLLGQLLTPQRQGATIGQRLNQGLHTASLVKSLFRR